MLGNVQVLSASFLSLLCVTVFVSSSMTAIENVLNQDVGLTSTPEEINRYYAVSFGAYAANRVCLHDVTLREGQRYRRAKFASAYCFSGRVHVWAVLREDAETVYGFGILMTVCVRSVRERDGILVCAAKGENTKMRRSEEEM